MPRALCDAVRRCRIQAFTWDRSARIHTYIHCARNPYIELLLVWASRFGVAVVVLSGVAVEAVLPGSAFGNGGMRDWCFVMFCTITLLAAFLLLGEHWGKGYNDGFMTGCE